MAISRNIFISLILLLVAGCDDYFTPESASNYSSEAVFENEDLAEKAVTGIYAAMCDDNLYSKKVTFYYSMNTDIEYISGSTDAGRRAIARYCATPTNSEIYGPWTNLYAAIEKANNCIYGLKNSSLLLTGTEQQKIKINQLLSTALCLRAVLYYDLVKNWGDVPFHTEPTYITKTKTLPATDRHVIFDQLINDLSFAENYLPWASELQSNEVVNKGFAKGLKARICLFNGGYSPNRLTNVNERPINYLDYYVIANSECLSVINEGPHSLNPSFKDIFNKECNYQSDIVYYEPLFELAFGRLSSGELGYYIGTKHEENPLYGKSEAGMLAPPNYFYSFDNSDCRRDITCSYYKYNADGRQELTSITALTLAKWRKEWIKPSITGSAKYTGVNFPFMRFSDILLMLAETENEIHDGPTENAKNALMAVRSRAFPDSLHQEKVIDYVNSLSSKDVFFNAIVNERAWEFGGESIRKYDLIRWGLLEQKLEECKKNLALIQKKENPFEHVPAKVYWKQIENKEEIDVANIDKNLPSLSYDLSNTKTQKWSSNLATSYINRVYEGNPSIKQFLPIPQQAITDSEGKLTNAYGY